MTERRRVLASVLNVRSGPGTAYPIVHRVRKNAELEVVEERGGWTRISEGWVSSVYLDSSKLKAPVGVLGIMQMFGAPASPACYSGQCQLPEPLKLGWEDKSVSRFVCHKLLERQFNDVFERIHSEGFWKDLKTFDGCYNDREIKGNKVRRSTHAWGIAVDLNAKENPLGSEEGAMSREVVRIFEEEGFLWGGNFAKRKDPMHFQFANGY